jgi:hypothetical protein
MVRWAIIGCLLFASGVPAVGRDDKAPLPEKPDATTPTADGEFAGKFLAVTAYAPGTKEEFTVLLEKARVRQLGGRSFITGRWPDTGPETKKYNGRTVWVPVSNVTGIYEYDTLKDLKECRSE